MLRRLITNDLRSNKLISVSTVIFMAVTAMLLGLSVFLFGTLSSSIDSLMKKAETPHFLQMHTGDLQMEKISDFANDFGSSATAPIAAGAPEATAIPHPIEPRPTARAAAM